MKSKIVNGTIQEREYEIRLENNEILKRKKILMHMFKFVFIETQREK